MAYQESPAARLRALRQRWESDRTSRVFLQLAEEHRRQGMPSEALSVLEEGLRHHSTSIAGQVALGRCRLELGQAEGAAAVLEKVVERDPTQMVAYRTLVDAYLRLGAATEARDRLSHYAQLNPQDPELESLDREIANLERAALRAVEPVPAPADDATPPEPEEGIDSGADRGDAVADGGDAFAALWPGQAATAAPTPSWSTRLAEPSWVDSAQAQEEPPEPRRSWPGWVPADDDSTAVFSLVDQPTAAPDSSDGAEVPAAPDSPGPARGDQPSELETVFFHLDEVAAARLGPPLARLEETSHAAVAPSWAAGPDQESSDSAPREADDGGIELEPHAAVDAAPPAESSSWSIGESEIVFSLPATPLLRDVGDLATVPWRPLASPAWLRPAGDVVAAGAGHSAPQISGTPTLAQLYLEQGHAEEAGQLFEQVLERDPENEAARAGLDRAQSRLGRPSARSLLRGFESANAGLSAKQAHVLRRWAALVREAHRRDAP